VTLMAHFLEAPKEFCGPSRFVVGESTSCFGRAFSHLTLPASLENKII